MDAPDFLAVVDVDPRSDTYSQVVHCMPLPYKGDELHHYGWQGWPFPVPALVTDQLISMDDRFLYCSLWLHGEVRQYDITDPARPRLAGRVLLPGVVRQMALNGRELSGGPQMLQLSLDGRRLYVTSSLLSSWDNPFFPGHRSWMLKIDIAPDGRMKLDPGFYVDFAPARAHEVHLPGGDCTTETFS
mgnify:CR=1 FL=1